jgi:hypothetical protein
MTAATPPLGGRPSASLIVATRDRPEFLPIVLACCRHQSYLPLETIVVDDGERFPVSQAVVAAAGAHLIRAEPDTPLGTKLNLGIDVARGAVCLKIDDDDWYGSTYAETMIGRLIQDWADGERAALVVAVPFLIFDLARWEIRRSIDSQYAGATLCFRRQDWADHPFPPVHRYEDTTFYGEQVSRGTRTLGVAAPASYLAVRHGGIGPNRGHTWVTQPSAVSVEDHLRGRPLHERSPEEMLPAWVIKQYRMMHRRLRAINAGPVTTDLGLLPPTRGVRSSMDDSPSCRPTD